MNKQLKLFLIAMWSVCGVAIAGASAMAFHYRHTGPAAKVYVSDIPRPDDKLVPIFDAPAFKLTDQDGRPFDEESLVGKIWVADFIFTNCPGLCPMMTQQMSEFQKRTAGTDVQLVSISVDPERDTPAALKIYAADAKADLTRWHFLTGDKEAVWNLSNGMKLAVGPGDTNHQVMHSSHFLLVDRSGHVRGVYDYKNAGFMANLVADTHTLLGEVK